MGLQTLKRLGLLPGGPFPGAKVVLPTTDTGYKLYDKGGRLFLPAATNYVTNPSFETDSNADGRADGWSWRTASVLTADRVPGRLGRYAQRLRSVDVPSSSAGDYRTTVNGCAPGDVVTVSMYMKLATTGCNWKVLLYNSDYSSIAASASLTAFADWTRVSVTGTVAGDGNVLVYIQFQNFEAGDSTELLVDDIQLEKSAFATPYFDGSYPDCAWTGTANASTSTRTKSSLKYDLPSYLSGSGTLAALVKPLDGKTTHSGTEYILMYDAGGADAGFCRVVSGVPQGWAGGAWVGGFSDSYSAGSPLAIVTSWDSGQTRTYLNGVKHSGAAPTIPSVRKLLYIGNDSYFASPVYAALYSSVIASPYPKSDAWVSAVQSVLNDPARLWRDFMEPGDMLIPLQSDSRAYLKQSGAQSGAYDYVFTGADPTTDTGWESYS